MAKEDAPQSLFIHCKSAYDLMFQRAEMRTIENVEVLVYEGGITRLITSDLNLSVPYFSKIRSALMELGCITQLKRGGGSAGSIWALNFEPTEETFELLQPRKPKNDTEMSMLQAQVATLNRRVLDLEAFKEQVIKSMLEEQDNG